MIYRHIFRRARWLFVASLMSWWWRLGIGYSGRRRQSQPKTKQEKMPDNKIKWDNANKLSVDRNKRKRKETKKRNQKQNKEDEKRHGEDNISSTELCRLSCLFFVLFGFIYFGALTLEQQSQKPICLAGRFIFLKPSRPPPRQPMTDEYLTNSFWMGGVDQIYCTYTVYQDRILRLWCENRSQRRRR